MKDDPAGEWFPLEEAEHEAQLEALLDLIPEGSSILDLGAGNGRIAKPLAQAGRRVIAIDHDQAAIRELEDSPNVHAVHSDILNDSISLLPEDTGETVDAALCLGHTMMLITDPLLALGFFSRIARVVRPGGTFVIDAFPHSLWPALTEGDWQSGVSEDALMQMVWHGADNVFTIRSGDEVNQNEWSLKPEDRLLRLWSMGELSLLAKVSGFLSPVAEPERYLIRFERAR